MSRKRATLPSHRIETRKVADLRPADYNPRKIDKKAQAGLTASIERFGAVQPIIVNERTGNIVGGHQRLKSLVELGQTETTVVVIDVDEVEEKALNVALNNPHIAGEFTDALGSILDDIADGAPDLFTDLRLDELLEDPKPPEGDCHRWVAAWEIVAPAKIAEDIDAILREVAQMPGVTIERKSGKKRKGKAGPSDTGRTPGRSLQ